MSKTPDLRMYGMIMNVGRMSCAAGFSRFSSDIEMMLGHGPNPYFKVTWTVVSPLALVVSV